MEALGLDTNWLYNSVLDTVVPQAVGNLATKSSAK